VRFGSQSIFTSVPRSKRFQKFVIGTAAATLCRTSLSPASMAEPKETKDKEFEIILNKRGDEAATKTKGKLFNKKHPDTKFALLSLENDVVIGENIFDVSQFEPDRIDRFEFCLERHHFYKFEDLGLHIFDLSDQENLYMHTHFSVVTIPDDADVYMDRRTDKKYIANKLIVSEKKVINTDNDICAIILEQDPEYLQFVKNPTEEMCLNAVKKDPFCLQYVKNQTEKICIAAVKLEPHRLEYVNDQTYEICRIAVELDPTTLKYVKNKTLRLCYLAAKALLRS